MKLIEILRLVWLNIFETKSKVLLTSLGIVVGSATIILVIAIGNGGQLEVQEQYKNLNVGAIEVTVGQSLDKMLEGMMENMPSGGKMPSGGQMPSFGGGNMPSGGAPSGGFSGRGSSSGGGMPSGGGRMDITKSNVTLTVEDAQDIASLVPDIAAVSILTSGEGAVLGGDLEEEVTTSVVGVMSDYVNISNLELLYGEFITEYDEEDKAKVAVIGFAKAQEIFGSAYYAQDQVVQIEGKNYTVVGVLAEMGTVASGISPDEAIYVPYSTAKKYILGSSAETQLSAVASEVSEVDTVIANIEAVLTENYPNASFTFTDAGSKMEAALASAKTLSMLLISVASIVFVVGGIGIMNVLFVSVKERTQEIGILKALGSSKREILLEFLMEANFIATFGGIVGVGVGYALVPVLQMLGATAVPLSSSAFLALAFAILTGTLFGFYPAYKASILTPIKALSQD